MEKLNDPYTAATPHGHKVSIAEIVNWAWGGTHLG
jgi:hypothetical protein